MRTPNITLIILALLAVAVWYVFFRLQPPVYVCVGPDDPRCDPPDYDYGP